MAAIEQMVITLPADMAAAVKATVADGQYASESDVVREALRDWTRARGLEQQQVDRLRQEIRKGDESGTSIPASEVFAQLRQMVAERRHNP